MSAYSMTKESKLINIYVQYFYINAQISGGWIT